jgi:predicted phage-related endonuclease
MTTTDPAAVERGEALTAADKLSVELPAEAANWRALVADCDSKIKDLEEVKALARGHLERMMGACEIGTIDGRPAVRWTYVESTRLQTSKLKANEPEVYERYCAPQVTRRFSILQDGEQ